MIKKLLLGTTILTLSVSVFANFATYKPKNKDDSYFHEVSQFPTYQHANYNSYGEVSKKTGHIKTERVEKYNRRDGTQVDSYYRSKGKSKGY